MHSFIDRGEYLFDNVVEGHVDGEIDFCSIDIDGLDLEIFETFEKFLPTVVCIEGGQMLEPFNERIPEDKAEQNIQQSLKVFSDSFTKKGYKILCSYQDTFFVKEEKYHLFETSPDIMELYFDGLAAHHRRMPWIKYMVERFIDHLLQSSNYNKYGYNNRKQWAIEERDLTLQNIHDLKSRYINSKK